MSKTPRLVAIEILSEWHKSKVSIDRLAGDIYPFKDARDAGLFKAIVFGVLRNLSLLDWVSARYSKQPLKKLKPAVLQALRVGIYQLLYMDRVPPSAAVNETVKALKSLKQPRWITGFVNGVLRNVERQKDSLLSLVNACNIPANVRLNHPEWLVKKWAKTYGQSHCDEMCEVNNSPTGVCLRVNTLKVEGEVFAGMLKEQGIKYSPGKYVPLSFWIESEVGLIENLPGYKEGYFSVQDETAQLLCLLLGPFERGTYLDACAGLGGKTTILAQCVPEGSLVVAVEPSEHRLALLRVNFERLGIAGVDVFEGHLQDYQKIADQKFQAIMVDAPCSGLGVTGRHPDIRWARQPDDLKRYQKLQLELLETASSMVKPEGIMVYATCSTEPEENDEVVEQFLKKNTNFKLTDARKVLSGNAEDLIDEKGYLRTIPGKKFSDGFFAARLVHT